MMYGTFHKKGIIHDIPILGILDLILNKRRILL